MRFIHPAAGAVALATILSFWTSTAFVELFGSTQALVFVKTAIPWGFLILIPALATAGATGFLAARERRGGLVDAKRKRMPVIAANGLLILVPCALYLASAARAGAFGSAFYGVQAVELVAGAANIALLGLNFRDGLRMTRRVDGHSRLSAGGARR